MTTIGRFRIVAFWEGISFRLLLFGPPFFFSLLAMPGDEANTMPPGHGVCR